MQKMFIVIAIVQIQVVTCNIAYRIVHFIKDEWLLLMASREMRAYGVIRGKDRRSWGNDLFPVVLPLIEIFPRVLKRIVQVW